MQPVQTLTDQFRQYRWHLLSTASRTVIQGALRLRDWERYLDRGCRYEGELSVTTSIKRAKGWK